MGSAPAHRHESDPEIVGSNRLAYWVLVLCWIGANLLFWSWWLQPSHSISLVMFLLYSIPFAYDASFLPSMYLFFVGHMHRPRFVGAPSGKKVALITLCVPSTESIDVIVRQLEALVGVEYPHDSWVLDEGDDPAVRAAAHRFGVHYFTRAGVKRYNQPNPPFVTKTKAGNVNAWLDAHGQDYDFFVQYDIDHRPNPNYLDRVLGYFDDPKIAWVQGPSLYGNLDNWLSRGAAEQELVLQGPLQRGFYGFSQTPFIIGSHCTYRTSAVMEIGGFQPTRAEDHLDTVVLSTHGYRGVFVPETLAVGDGPDTFETYLRQQFAWAYSMMQILFHYGWRLVRESEPRQALQFMFAQTWYPFWSMSMLALFALPILVLVTGLRPSNVDLASFALFSAPLMLTSLAAWLWTRAWQMPAGLGLSWRGIILHVARWPIVVWALINVVLRVKHPYMITPKGSGSELPRFSLQAQAIYVALAGLSLVAIWVSVASASESATRGYVLFALLGAGYMLAIVLTNVVADFVGLARCGVDWVHAVRLRTRPLVVLATFLIAVGGTLLANGDEVRAAALWQPIRPESYWQIVVADASSRELPVGASVASEAGNSESPARRSLPSMVATTRKPLDLPIDRVAVGAYSLTSHETSLDVEQWFINDDNSTELATNLAGLRDDVIPLVTIESMTQIGRSGGILQEMVGGERDGYLRDLAHVISAERPRTVIVRWGHEMDLIGLYPWSGQDASLYRAAYRHVVAVFRSEGADNVRWVWSPAGNVGSDAYYPGDDVVDYVGLTVLGDAAWDNLYALPPQSFDQLMVDKYQRVKSLNKPIIIAELGVSGTQTRQATWLADAVRDLSKYPLVRAVVYFNEVNSTNNRLQHQPDWRLTPTLWSDFASKLRQAGAVISVPDSLLPRP